MHSYFDHKALPLKSVSKPSHLWNDKPIEIIIEITFTVHSYISITNPSSLKVLFPHVMVTLRIGHVVRSRRPSGASPPRHPPLGKGRKNVRGAHTFQQFDIAMWGFPKIEVTWFIRENPMNKWMTTGGTPLS